MILKRMPGFVRFVFSETPKVTSLFLFLLFACVCNYSELFHICMLKCVRIVSGTTKDFVLQTTPLSRVGSSLPDGIVNQVSASP